jgi:hypothetical protein
LDDYEDDGEEENPNYDPSDVECDDLDQLLDDRVEDADTALHVESDLESSNVAYAAAEDEVLGKLHY